MDQQVLRILEFDLPLELVFGLMIVAAINGNTLLGQPVIPVPFGRDDEL